MNALGKHLLLELKDCDRQALNDQEFLRNTLISAANECGAKVLGETFHTFEPQGVSGVVAIAESHLSIHTWPEYGYAAADIFTCGSSVKPEKAAEIIISRLGSKNHSIIEIHRGLLDIPK
ncbi:MAG: adenosylmethionine decarboxylase [Dehalococcoidales bacterium]|nr:adenosylmethionine decarboxylase [Dehalococcoidales bacterium]